MAESRVIQLVRGEKQSKRERELEKVNKFTGMDKWQQHRAIEKLQEKALNQTRRINNRRVQFRKLKENLRGLKGDGKWQKELLNETEDEKDEDDSFDGAETGSGSFEKGNFLESLEKMIVTT